MFTRQNKQDIIRILKNNFLNINDNSIRDINYLPGGTDTKIYNFILKSDEMYIPLVLKLFRNRLPPTRSQDEYLNLCQIFESKIKVPKPFGFLDNSCSFSQPFMIMEFIQGKLLSEVIYSNLNQNNDLFTKFITNLVLIHNINWQVIFKEIPIPDIKSDPYIIINTTIKRSKNLIQEFSIKEFYPIIAWLEENSFKYPADQLVLCHGDYHPKNIIINSHQELVTMDWSNVALSDRRIDLAFTIVMMSSETDQDIEEFILRSYESITNVEIVGIDFFKVLTNLFNFIRIFSAASNFNITQETTETRNVFLNEYKPYCLAVFSLMKHQVNSSFSTIEKFLQN